MGTELLSSQKYVNNLPILITVLKPSSPMLRQDVRPNMFTYSSVLRACEDLSVLEQILSSIFKDGLESDCFVRSALVDIYLKWGHSNNALSIFNEMVTNDLVVWNSGIGGFAQNSQGNEAMILFIRMKRGGIYADQPTLTSVLRACTSLALLELGRQVHVHVVKFKTDLIQNNALLDMYCKCGSLKDAKSVFDPMAEMDVIICYDCRISTKWLQHPSTQVIRANESFGNMQTKLYHSCRGSVCV